MAQISSNYINNVQIDWSLPTPFPSWNISIIFYDHKTRSFSSFSDIINNLEFGSHIAKNQSEIFQK